MNDPEVPMEQTPKTKGEKISRRRFLRTAFTAAGASALAAGVGIKLARKPQEVEAKEIPPEAENKGESQLGTRRSSSMTGKQASSQLEIGVPSSKTETKNTEFDPRPFSHVTISNIKDFDGKPLEPIAVDLAVIRLDSKTGEWDKDAGSFPGWRYGGNYLLNTGPTTPHNMYIHARTSARATLGNKRARIFTEEDVAKGICQEEEISTITITNPETGESKELVPVARFVSFGGIEQQQEIIETILAMPNADCWMVSCFGLSITNEEDRSIYALRYKAKAESAPAPPEPTHAF